MVNRDSNASALFLWNGAHYAVAASATLILDAGGVILYDSGNVTAVPAKRTCACRRSLPSLTFCNNISQIHRGCRPRHADVAVLERELDGDA